MLADEALDHAENHNHMTVFQQHQFDAIDRLKALAAKHGAEGAEIAEAAEIGPRRAR